jgi:aryl-alcohol dehydrogenase-like predicted oxidoreductase
MELRGPPGGFGRAIEPSESDALLHRVLDAGIDFIDTSPDYGESEERIGRAISHRRDEYFLASKCGCPVGPLAPGTAGRAPHVFTRENIRAGVEQSLRRMKTDRLDLVQFHISPSREILEQHDSVAELLALRDEGKVLFLGMSGTLPHLADHIAMGVFDAFQIPYSALEPEHEQWITNAARAGAGIVVRGGVARGIPEARREALERLPERFREAFVRRYDLWARARLEDLLEGMSRMEFMLRYTLSHPDMTTTIVGTANPKHLEDNLAAAARGALPPELYSAARERLAAAR